MDSAVSPVPRIDWATYRHLDHSDNRGGAYAAHPLAPPLLFRWLNFVRDIYFSRCLSLRRPFNFRSLI